MKKLLLVVVLFTTSMLFAQTEAACEDCSIDKKDVDRVNVADNTNQIDQVGKYNYANVYQDGNANYSKIDQNGLNQWYTGGKSNDAYVSQVGIKNESDIKQHGDDNMSKVWQEGYKNFAKVDVGVGYAEDNVTEIKQFGNKHMAFQKQRYDNNEAYINQKGGTSFVGWFSGNTYYVGGENYAEQDQTSIHGGPGNIAHITQNGTKNAALQVQNGYYNNANSTQTGYGNISVETQNSDDDGVNNSTVNQTSWFWGNNTACVTQNADNGFMNTSFVTQLGDCNYASVNQSASLGNNMSTINQTGWSNGACVQQVNGTTSF